MDIQSLFQQPDLSLQRVREITNKDFKVYWLTSSEFKWILLNSLKVGFFSYILFFALILTTGVDILTPVIIFDILSFFFFFFFIKMLQKQFGEGIVFFLETEFNYFQLIFRKKQVKQISQKKEVNARLNYEKVV